MQPEELARHLSALTNAFAAAIRADPAARETARALATWLMNAAGDGTSPSAAAETDASGAATTSAITPLAPPPQPVQNIELIVGGQRLMLSVPGSDQEAVAARDAAMRGNSDSVINGVASSAGSSPPGQTNDLTLVATRCRVKAEGCAWAARYREHYDPDDYDGRAAYKDIIGRAKALPNCYVWATNPNLVIPPTAVMRDFALGYANLALAAELAKRVHEERGIGGEARAEAYQLLAEAQSALRAALENESLYADNDQESAFHWLRSRTYEDRILVPRHMRMDDPADIEKGSELQARLEAMNARLSDQRQHDAQRRTQLNKARYHAKRLMDGKSDARSDDVAGDWRTIMDVVSGLVDHGVPPSDVEIRDLVLPMVDLMPDDLEWSQSFERVMDSIDRYVALREELRAESPDGQGHGKQWSAQVREVAHLLRGGVAVLVGGQRRQQSLERLRDAFELEDVHWTSSDPHESISIFEPAIARDDTSIVILAIRWSSHSYEGVKAMCEKYGKPFVRLPGGYNPNQVASQILAQVGDRLAAAARTA